MKYSNFLFLAVFVATFVGIAPASLRAETFGSATMPAPLDGQDLAATSGLGESTSTAIVESTVTGNKIGYVGYTGGIRDVTASNNSGMTTLIENTGNQVSISTVTNLNVFYH